MRKGKRGLPFFKTKPSCTGVTEVVLAPTSMTRALGFPAANLQDGQPSTLSLDETWTYAASTPVLPSQKAGAPQSSSAISMHFARFFAEFQAGSDMSNGCSLMGFSCSSIPSMATSPSPSAGLSPSSVSSLRPFFAAGVGRAPVNREVMLYSHSLEAASQSSTMPSESYGLRISMFGRGLWMAFSPKRYRDWESASAAAIEP